MEKNLIELIRDEINRDWSKEYSASVNEDKDLLTIKYNLLPVLKYDSDMNLIKENNLNLGVLIEDNFKDAIEQIDYMLTR